MSLRSNVVDYTLVIPLNSLVRTHEDDLFVHSLHSVWGDSMLLVLVGLLKIESNLGFSYLLAKLALSDRRVYVPYYG